MSLLIWLGLTSFYVCESLLLPHIPDIVCFTSNFGDLTKYALTGATAGVCRALSRGLTFPFDTKKTLQQAETRMEGAEKKFERNPLNFQKYFKGVTPIIIGAVPAQASFFVSYHILEVWSNCLVSQWGMESEEFTRFFQRLLISTFSSIPANVFKIPAEVWKQDSQLVGQDMSFQQFYENSNGLPGIYRGGKSMLLREIPYNALQFSFYGKLSEDSFWSFTQNAPLWQDSLHLGSALHSAVLGTIAAGLAASCTQPADVLKTRMMTSTFVLDIQAQEISIADGQSGTDTNPPTLLGSARELYSKRGLAGFWVGLPSRLALTTIGGFVFFGSSQLVGGGLLSIGGK